MKAPCRTPGDARPAVHASSEAANKTAQAAADAVKAGDTRGSPTVAAAHSPDVGRLTRRRGSVFQRQSTGTISRPEMGGSSPPTSKDLARLKISQQHDSRHGLTRSEMIQCLCRIAVARYVLTPRTPRTPKAGKTDV